MKSLIHKPLSLITKTRIRGLDAFRGPGLQLLVLSVPLWGHVATPDPFPSRGRVRAVGVVRWSPDSRSWQNSNGS